MCARQHFVAAHPGRRLGHRRPAGRLDAGCGRPASNPQGRATDPPATVPSHAGRAPAAQRHRAVGLGPDGWPAGAIDPGELSPCPKCGMLEPWQTIAGNWRCQRCDPPTKTVQLLEAVERIRRRQQARKKWIVGLVDLQGPGPKRSAILSD